MRALRQRSFAASLHPIVLYPNAIRSCLERFFDLLDLLWLAVDPLGVLSLSDVRLPYNKFAFVHIATHDPVYLPGMLAQVIIMISSTLSLATLLVALLLANPAVLRMTNELALAVTVAILLWLAAIVARVNLHLAARHLRAVNSAWLGGIVNHSVKHSVVTVMAVVGDSVAASSRT